MTISFPGLSLPDRRNNAESGGSPLAEWSGTGL